MGSFGSQAGAKNAIFVYGRVYRNYAVPETSGTFNPCLIFETIGVDFNGALRLCIFSV